MARRKKSPSSPDREKPPDAEPTQLVRWDWAKIALKELRKLPIPAQAALNLLIEEVRDPAKRHGLPKNKHQKEGDLWAVKVQIANSWYRVFYTSKAGVATFVAVAATQKSSNKMPPQQLAQYEKRARAEIAARTKRKK